MKSDFELLRYSRKKQAVFKLGYFFQSIPGKFKRFGIKIGRAFKRLGLFIYHDILDIINTFKNGNWRTRLSYLIMGFGSFFNKQRLRGILFFLMEVVFGLYMGFIGARYLSRLGTLGTVVRHVEYEKIGGIIVEKVIYGDDSFKILLYSILTIIFIIAFIYTWRLNVKQNKIAESIIKSGKPIKSTKDDLKSVLDNDFHKTLLALPTLGIIIFTVIPIIFMILIAFTNYDMTHTPPYNLFGWVGLSNFNKLFTWNAGGSTFSAAFGEILVWTLIWAVFATFTTYFIGMGIAMLINRKGIKLKRLWRTILVLTIAVPGFISLSFVSKMFSNTGIVNTTLQQMHLITDPINFWDNVWISRVLVIVINIWVGVPYLMLVTTGILINIPADLYESSKIDGASPMKQFTKITLPYMLFVTGPYLLTNFIGNMNNFNVIYLLTGGAPTTPNSYKSGGTDLLITWLFKMTVEQNDYKTAAVIGILVFIVVAFISLVVYNLLPSTRNEEAFQ